MTDLDDRQPDRALLDRLERHLDHMSDDVRLRSSSVATAVARARQRQRRRNVAAAGTSLVAVVAAIATVAIVQQPGPRPADGDRNGTTITSETTIGSETIVPPSTAAETEPTTTPTTESATAPSPAPPDAAADAVELIAPDGADPSTWVFGPRIAWDREAAIGTPRVFVSDDAVVWRPVASVPLARLWGGERDDEGVLRLVGSTAGDAASVVLATSTDDGGSWSTTDLPIDLGPGLDASDPGGVSFVSATLASADGTTVIAVSGAGYRRFLLTVLADGSVIDAADTGLDLDAQLPLVEATQFVSVGLADDAGFVAVGGFSSDVTRLTFWTSGDGRTWTESGTTEQSVGLVGRIGDRFVSAASPLSASADLITWDPLPPISVDPETPAVWTPTLATIRDGRLAVLLFAEGTQPVASFVKDGILVRIAANLDTTFFDETTGEYLGGFVGNVYDGPVRTVGASFELLDEAGEVRVSVSLDEATAALQGVTDVEDPPDRWAIATTSDLSTWSVDEITGLLPERAGALALDIVGDRAAATMAVLGDSGFGLPLTVIRTPPF
jgi:hypothetical protein